jgi:predicted nucleic acid-binding Zn ribbon protein
LGGHATYRGPNWDRQSKAARQRDNDTCQHCGISAPHLPVHHIMPFRLFTDYRAANALDNLVTLCPICHGAAELDFWNSHPELNHLAPPFMVAPVQHCRSCGKEFTPDRAGTKYCSRACYMRNVNPRRQFFAARKLAAQPSDHPAGDT